jgi:hypothetical protein
MHAKLFKKVPCFLWNPNVGYLGNRSPSLDTTLSLANPLQNVIAYVQDRGKLKEVVEKAKTFK